MKFSAIVEIRYVTLDSNKGMGTNNHAKARSLLGMELKRKWEKFIHLPKDATKNLTLPLPLVEKTIPVRSGSPRPEPQMGMESEVILQIFCWTPQDKK